MTIALGLLFLVVFAASFVPLRRLIRSAERPRWLADPLVAEHVLLAHIALLIVGLSLIAWTL